MLWVCHNMPAKLTVCHRVVNFKRTVNTMRAHGRALVDRRAIGEHVWGPSPLVPTRRHTAKVLGMPKTFAVSHRVHTSGCTRRDCHRLLPLVIKSNGMGPLGLAGMSPTKYN